MTEIELEDPQPSAGGGASTSPYKNLFVPLIVVPAMIVFVLVLVFVLFGAIAGSESTPRENLQTMLGGGANERTQAAFNLAQQVFHDIQAERDDDPLTVPEWEIGPGFLPEVRVAWSRTQQDDHEIRFVLAMLLAFLEDEDGLDHVLEMLRQIPAEDDESGQIRFFLLNLLGQLGDPRAAPDVIAYLGHEDEALRQIAAGALQTMPGPETTAALRGTLSASNLALRGMAAISLAVLGDPAGQGTLHELLDPGSFERDRQLDPGRWKRALDVRYARQRALVGLARLHRAEDRAAIQGVAERDGDPDVRATALKLLQGWDDLPSAGDPPEGP